LIDGSVPLPRLLVIHNHAAAAKRRERFEAVVAGLAAAGCAVTVRRTEDAGDAARFAAEAHPEDVDIIAVAGGDGTINDALNGFGPDSPPLGLIPLGTANVLAHEIGLSLEPERIVACLLGGATRSVVPGVVNGRRFMMMASIGFDAHVVGGVRKAVKRRIGKLAYALEALRQLVRYPCPPLEVRVDGQPVKAATLVAQRGRLYGGRFVLAPEADLGQALFQATLFPRAGRLAMAGYSLALPLGLLTRLGLVRHVAARTIEVTSRPGDPVQGDGDVVARLPATLSLADHPVRLVVPASP
jgi:YegS/Rv2252/BmrU family lipid kinase